MNFARDGYGSIIGGAVAVGLSLFWPPALVLTIPMLAIILWFYRDPERNTPQNDRFLISPADGTVIEIFETDHEFTGKALKIGIFMNPFNVHVNRMPSKGTISYLQYVPGRKWVASGDKASEENERMYVGYDSPLGPVLVCQIAGLLARRIVCRLKKGDVLAAGQRFGMIKLGSKVDIYLPDGTDCLVTQGQKVLAGETILAEVTGR